MENYSLEIKFGVLDCVGTLKQSSPIGRLGSLLFS